MQGSKKGCKVSIGILLRGGRIPVRKLRDMSKEEEV
jgi:hypothetical protein